MKYKAMTIRENTIGDIELKIQEQLDAGWMVHRLSTSTLSPWGDDILVAVVIFQAWEREGEPG